MFVIKPFSFRALVADVTMLWKNSAYSQVTCVRMCCFSFWVVCSGNNLFEKKWPHLKEMSDIELNALF